YRRRHAVAWSGALLVEAKRRGVDLHAGTDVNLRNGPIILRQDVPVQPTDNRVGPGTMEALPGTIIPQWRLKMIAQRHDLLLSGGQVFLPCHSTFDFSPPSSDGSS